MTRIDQIHPGVAPGTGEAAKTRPGQGDQAFQRVLEQAAASLGEPAQAAKPAVFAPLPTIQSVEPPLGLAELGPEKAEGLARAGRALDILELYGQALGDERRSLKEVAALVRDLDGEVKGLTQAMEKIDPQDKLYGLLQEVAVASMVESIKFNRGDHLPAEPAA